MAIVASSLSHFSSWAYSSLWQRRIATQPHPQFSIDSSSLSDGTIQHSIDIIPKGTSFNTHPGYPKFVLIDRQKDGEKLGTEVHTVLTRFAYIVKKEVSHYTPQRLKDFEFIKLWSSCPTLEALNADTLRFPGSSTTPGFDQTIEVFSGEDELKNKVDNLASLSPEIGRPESIRFTHNHNYTRLLGQLTSHSAQMSTAFYPTNNPRQTLIVQSAVTYLYNVPPKMLGGIERVKKGIREAFFQSINNLDKI